MGKCFSKPKLKPDIKVDKYVSRILELHRASPHSNASRRSMAKSKQIKETYDIDDNTTNIEKRNRRNSLNLRSSSNNGPLDRLKMIEAMDAVSSPLARNYVVNNSQK